MTFWVGNLCFCLEYKGALQWLYVYWSPLKCCWFCQLNVTDLHHGETLWPKIRGNMSQGIPCSFWEITKDSSTPLELPGVQQGPQPTLVRWARVPGAQELFVLHSVGRSATNQHPEQQSCAYRSLQNYNYRIRLLLKQHIPLGGVVLPHWYGAFPVALPAQTSSAHW